ncbi:MAG: aminotransferase class I/II-fold pyridoxal phosphate-dependent enzyme [Erysipelotrichaceae bacterium]|nr:aminotransferase class I/II-fold pyridoxal phosphate-dependent enzyme [Erysipelotrichaceae bacterium]
MYSFKNDYNQTCHPKIVEALKEIEDYQFSGYGLDEICDRAKTKINTALESNSDIHFLVGGTQTNLTVISYLLKPYQGVISVDTGHINVHETGAIEACGHKVISIISNDGKLKAKDVEDLIKSHYEDDNCEHCTMPGMVYISNPTELGTLYTKKELSDLYSVTKKYDIPLYLDGARLAYALSGLNNDIALNEYKNLVDVLYIGGTKCGALFGEAVVFNQSKLSKNFRYSMKQRGGMLAKGFLLGLQFDILFSDNLYYELGKHANDIAFVLNDELEKRNIKMFSKRYSNQLFLILNKKVIEALKEKYAFEYWSDVDENTACIRIVISWSTQKEKIFEFINDFDAICM